MSDRKLKVAASVSRLLSGGASGAVVTRLLTQGHGRLAAVTTAALLASFFSGMLTGVEAER